MTHNTPIQTQPRRAPATRHFEIQGEVFGDIPCRMLGPVQQWGAEIVVDPVHRSSVEAAVQSVSERLHRPIAGYFYTLDDTLRFHVSRLPRRIGEPIPPSTLFKESVEAIQQALSLQDPNCRVQYDSKHSFCERFVLGLQEGYASKDKPVVTHSFDSIKGKLPIVNNVGTISASIYSCHPQFGIYEEPAFLVLNGGKESILSAVTAIAHETRQARFSYEDGDKEAACNVEIMEHALVTSAQSRMVVPEPSRKLSLNETQLKSILLGESLPSIQLEEAYKKGKLIDFPELLRLRGVPQDPEWHPEGDVWIHTLKVVDEAWKLARANASFLSHDEQYELVLGALCHDLGKPLTTRLQDTTKKGIRWTAYGHEEAGVEPAKALLNRLGVSESTTSAVLNIVALHMDPPRFFRERKLERLNDATYERAVKKLLGKLNGSSWKVFLLAVEADQRGRDTVEAKQPVFDWQIKFTQTAEQCVELALPQRPAVPKLIDGKILMAELDMKQGAELGYLLDKVLEEVASGTVTTREDAIALARKLRET